MGSRNYLQTQGTFSNDINLAKTFRIRESSGIEVRASFFNPFNQVRRTGINTTQTYKMTGASAGERLLPVQYAGAAGREPGEQQPERERHRAV